MLLPIGTSEQRAAFFDPPSGPCAKDPYGLQVQLDWANRPPPPLKPTVHHTPPPLHFNSDAGQRPEPPPSGSALVLCFPTLTTRAGEVGENLPGWGQVVDEGALESILKLSANIESNLKLPSKCCTLMQIAYARTKVR